MQDNKIKNSLEAAIKAYSEACDLFNAASENSADEQMLKIGTDLLEKLKPHIVNLRQIIDENEECQYLLNNIAMLLLCSSIGYCNKKDCKEADIEVIPLISAALSLQNDSATLKRIQDNVCVFIHNLIQSYDKLLEDKTNDALKLVNTYVKDIVPFVILAKDAFGKNSDVYLKLSSQMTEWAVNQIIGIINKNPKELERTVHLKIKLDVLDKDGQYKAKRYNEFSRTFDQIVETSGVYRELQGGLGRRPTILARSSYNDTQSHRGFSLYREEIKESSDLRGEADLYENCLSRVKSSCEERLIQTDMSCFLAGYSGSTKYTNPIELYLEKYPFGKHIFEVSQMIEEIAFHEGNYERYLSDYPQGRFREEAKIKLEEQKIEKCTSIKQLQDYIKEHPNSQFVETAENRIKGLKAIEERRRKENERKQRLQQKIDDCKNVNEVIGLVNSENGIDINLCRKKAYSLCNDIIDYETFLKKFDDKSEESKKAKAYIKEVKEKEDMKRFYKCFFIGLIILVLVCLYAYFQK